VAEIGYQYHTIEAKESINWSRYDELLCVARKSVL